jgi:hypothetical protein
VESTVSSTRARQQLLTYISQLQLNTFAQSSKTNSAVAAQHQTETLLLRVGRPSRTCLAE